MTNRILGAALCVFALAGLPACTSAQRQEACAIDRSAQPIVVPVEGVASVGVPIAAIPIGVVHAVVQVGCAAILAPAP